MAKYRKKPVVIEAVRWWPGESLRIWLETHGVNGEIYENADRTLIIETLEGEMVAQPGDWIIRGVVGEVYPCKPKIFEQTYEAVEHG